jgi:DNA-binding GntR family transcriptional regulator
VAATKLHRDGPVALWRQLASDLAEGIAAGTYKPMERLPTEPELCAAYGVSRITVRQAVRHLTEQHLVMRQQGKGTFVVGPVMTHGLQELRGIVDAIHDQGIPLTTKLLDFGLVDPEPAARETLRVQNRKLVLLRRLYLTDGAPFGVTEIHLPAEAARVTRAQAETHSCYEILQTLLRIRIVRADISIRAQSASRQFADLLQTSPKTPLLLFERVSFCPDQVPREYTRFWVRAEAYRFTLSVSGAVRMGSGLRRLG